MTVRKPVRQRRLLAIERRLAGLEKTIELAMQMRVQHALMTSTLARLIGENDRLRENIGQLTESLYGHK